MNDEDEIVVVGVTKASPSKKALTASFCSLCDLKFDSRKDLERHLVLDHFKDRLNRRIPDYYSAIATNWECLKCDEILATRDDSLIHIGIAHREIVECLKVVNKKKSDAAAVAAKNNKIAILKKEHFESHPEGGSVIPSRIHNKTLATTLEVRAYLVKSSNF
jgi:hypothetical protein